MTVVNPKLEWQRAIIRLATVTTFVVVVAGLVWARSIFIPLALGVFFTFVLSPVVSWVQRRGAGRLPAVLATVLFAVTTVVFVGAMITWQVALLTEELPNHAENIKAKLADGKRWVSSQGNNRFSQMIDDVSTIVSPPKNQSPQGTTVVVENSDSSWWSQVSTYLGPVTEVIGQVAFAFVLSVFMLLKKEDLRNRIIRLTGDHTITTTTKAVDDASRRISRYLFVQLLINTVFGIIITATMVIIGVKYALLWGFLAMLMRYIPYLGTWIGLVPPVLFTLTVSDGWWQPMAIIGVYGSCEIICNNVFEPWLYGSSMGLSEVAQLVAAAFWAYLWGPIGLILSGPLTVCLLILGKYVPRLSYFQILLGDEPVLAPDVRLYQRLTAQDQDEALQIILAERKAGRGDDILDRVVIPALTYAQRDRDLEDLEPAAYARILATTREVVDELNSEPVESSAGSEPQISLLALPARDDADELLLELLTHQVDPRKWACEVAPVERLTSEYLTRVQETAPAVIAIGSLPPGGLAHTRYLCKRLRQKFPDTKLVVIRWGMTANEAEENRTALLEAGADQVTLSMAETLHYLSAWQPVFDSQQQQEIGKSPRRVRVGTTSA